ncbi:hypothetical protein B0H10DRAFT_2215228 [Mycena sp. CBHHK59/15]|nr:hypothetical protein B0H10DRAFT_2215228 [Mycena sp. CBHHK59/15]
MFPAPTTLESAPHAAALPVSHPILLPSKSKTLHHIPPPSCPRHAKSTFAAIRAATAPRGIICACWGTRGPAWPSSALSDTPLYYPAPPSPAPPSAPAAVLMGGRALAHIIAARHPRALPTFVPCGPPSPSLPGRAIRVTTPSPPSHG